jgi:uncharacterized protein YwbE
VRRFPIRALLLVLLAAVAPPATGDQEIPGELQAAIITRMLGYDRALKGRVGPSLTVGIVVKANDRSTVKIQTDMQTAFAAQQNVQGLPLTVKVHVYAAPAPFTDWLGSQGVDVLYVAEGLDKELESIRAQCVQKRVVGVSSVRAYVKQGLAIGVVKKGESAGILVNLPVAKALGMDLDPKLLSLAEIMN